MAKRTFKAGITSQTIDIFIQDSSSLVGAGLSGLAFGTAGLKAYYRKGATGSATAITLATQTVGGAFSSGGFVEVDATNMKGVYRFDVPDTVLASSPWATLYFYGATNMAPVVAELEIVAYDPFDATALGLSRIDAAVSSRMATYTQPTGFLAATFPSVIASTTNITAATGITVSTNSDKTGYSLSQAFPTNFSSLAITVGGAVTVGTNSDKTGYSLTQSFPTNFATLAITVGGAVTVGTNNDKTGYTASTVSDKTGYALTLAYDPAKTAAQAGDAMALTAGERNSTADALLDRTAGIETNYTPRQGLRLMAAVLLGKASGLATTTATYRDTNDLKNRVVATVDVNGNRSAVTLDAT